MTLDFETEKKSAFFSWFQLEPIEADETGGWRCFRPNGPAFRDLVEVDAKINSAGAIGAACIGIARSFIEDRRKGAFARDIAKSFLLWALRQPSERASILIANIARLDGSGGAVLMRGPPAPAPAPDSTGGYATFLGERDRAFLDLEGVSLENYPGPMPAASVFAAETRRGRANEAQSGGASWLRMDVRLSDAAPVSWWRRFGFWR